jgi:hypothetical protein
MISLKKLIMRPGSPDRALEQAFSESESALARIGHVNRLSRDIMDIKFYELDVNTTTTVKLKSKKGIVEIVNLDPTTTDLTIYLQNPEITADHHKFYVQLTAYSNNYNITPIVIGRGFSADLFAMQIKNLDVADDWGLFYIYYDFVKID